MQRFFKMVIAVVILATIGSLAINITQHYFARRDEILRLKRQRAELRQIIERLTGRTRRAELIVDGQVRGPDNKVVQTTLLWQEFTVGPNGRQIPMPLRKFTIPGDTPYIDALVLQFSDKYVEKGDLLRGKSIAFFRRIFSSRESPDQGASLLSKHGIPRVLEHRYGKPNKFLTRLWRNIWPLLKHPHLGKKMGLAVVQGEAHYRPVRPGKLYVIYVRNDGGLEFTEQPGESDLVKRLAKEASADRSIQTQPAATSP